MISTYAEEMEYLKREWKKIKPGVRIAFRSMYTDRWSHGTVVKKEYHGYLDATTNVTILWDLTDIEKAQNPLPASKETTILTAQYFIKQGMYGRLGLIVLGWV